MKYKVCMAGIILCASLLGEGCALHRLKGDLSRINELTMVSGSVSRDSACSTPVVVVLWALEGQEGATAGYWVVGSDGAFEFKRPSGRYYLFAFEDTNEDFRYQDNEYATTYRDFAVIDLDTGEGLKNVELHLRPPGEVQIPATVLEMSTEKRQKIFEWRKGQTGVVTTIDNPDFTQENGSLGLWEPLAFLEKFGMKVYFLEAFDPDKIPVLFVHGSTGYPSSWSSIITQMDREHFQPWLVFYPSGLRLELLGDAISKYLSELRLNHQFDELVVVAHSMGGLVSRSAILKQGQLKKRCKIPLYITMATPWQGHAGAGTGVKRSPVIVPAWYDMVPNSPFIQDLFSAPLPPETDHFLFFAFQGESGGVFKSENSDGTITLSSQLSESAQDEAFKTIGINSSHVGILSDTHMMDRLNRILNEYRIRKGIPADAK